MATYDGEINALMESYTTAQWERCQVVICDKREDNEIKAVIDLLPMLRDPWRCASQINRHVHPSYCALLKLEFSFEDEDRFRMSIEEDGFDHKRFSRLCYALHLTGRFSH
jgi:hypothetical protein